MRVEHNRRETGRMTPQEPGSLSPDDEDAEGAGKSAAVKSTVEKRVAQKTTAKKSPAAKASAEKAPAKKTRYRRATPGRNRRADAWRCPVASRRVACHPRAAGYVVQAPDQSACGDRERSALSRVVS
jgi:hypothetical protein